MSDNKFFKFLMRIQGDPKSPKYHHTFYAQDSLNPWNMVKWSYKYFPEGRPLFNIVSSVAVASVLFMMYELTNWDIMFNKSTYFLPCEKVKNRDKRRLLDVDLPWRGHIDHPLEEYIQEMQTWGLEDISKKQKAAKVGNRLVEEQAMKAHK